MCGVLLFHSSKINYSIKKKFIDSLKFMKNRGPDETLTYNNRNLLIGFNRLSINNLHNGSQPFKSKCGRYVVVFNGEIFNYKDLEKNLNVKGIKTKNASEVEIIYHYYKLYGNKCLQYFNGFFAIIVYDNLKKKIFSAVDRLGIKQLYYYYSKFENLLIITSDYSHFTKYKIFDLKINKLSLMNFLCFGRSFGKNTIFKKVYDLKPGNILIFENKSGIRIKRYWSNFKKNIKKFENKKYLEEFKKIFLISNNLWKKSEVKIANLLSTGLDSNLIEYGFKKNEIKNEKFSLIENKYQKNKTIKLTYKAKLNNNLVFKELIKFVKNNKNPFSLANSGSLSLFQLYKEIKKRKIKVCFTGEGGDEIFGGYERYKKQFFLLNKKKLKFTDHIIKTYKREIDLFNKFNNFYNVSKLNKNLNKSVNNIKILSKDNINKILEFDQITWLPMLLRRHDNIGMFYSIEVRPQLLDHNLVEFMNNIVPSSLKFNNKKTKILQKKLLKKFIRKKKYFKIGSPSTFNNTFDQKIINKIRKNLTKSLFLKRYFKTELILINDLFTKKNRIFLWRLFVLSIMFKNENFDY